MTEGTDIRHLSIPFTGGILAGSFILRFSNHPFFFAGLSSILLVSSLLIVLYRNRRSLLELQLLLVAAGLFCLFSEKASCCFAPEWPRLTLFCRELLDQASSLIRRLPYTDPESPALMQALVLGVKSDLTQPVLQAFREGGAAHILALSGFHMGIIYLFLSRLISLAGNAPGIRVARSLLILASTGLYVLVTGAAPSLVRAFLFILIRETALLLNRRTHLSQVLTAALFIQLFLQPAAIEEVGFQLSYLAMAGICWIHPQLKKWFPERDPSTPDFPVMRKIWDLASLSISCQLLTAPLAWFHFGNFPKYFLLTNLIALPLTTAIMVTGLVLVACSCFGPVPGFLLELNSTLIHWLVQSMTFLSDL